MLIFLLVFLTIYGSLHYYFYVKIKAAFALGFYPHLGIILFLAAMLLSPVAEHLFEGIGQLRAAKISAWIGYSWMGILFLFFSAALCLDLYRLLLHIGGSLLPIDATPLKPSARLVFLLPMALGVVIFIYGIFEANNLRVERVTIRSSKLSASISNFKIAQISDIHSGINHQKRIIDRTVAILKDESPDLLISTGDMFDSGDFDHAFDPLKSIEPRFGKFAVTGNHEFYAGLERALKCTREAGFIVLRGETAEVGGFLNIVGVDDPAGNYSHKNPKEDEAALLSSVPPDRFTLLLKHQPRVDVRSLGKFDLMLSGHTHNGQIFPFNLLVRPFYTASAGLLILAGGSQLYVSRGTGTWGPPIRFLAPPEVTIIEIVSAD
ncbi:MAG: metallophosphoesterase [bacterium]|nr:metallophosphoesterase [bacterium]